jgi:thiol:disulfide interchange protein DsbD
MSGKMRSRSLDYARDDGERKRTASAVRSSRNSSRALALAATIFSAAILALAASLAAQVPSGKDVVAPTTYASFDPVARGKSFELAVVLKIRPGFHINARPASEEYLIPTELRAELPAGFHAGEITYPKGKLHSFAFTKTQLSVYEETVVLKLPLTALESAPVGAQHIPLKLRYQACSNEICLPPVTKDVDATINVVAAPSAAKPAHSEFFTKAPPAPALAAH